MGIWSHGRSSGDRPRLLNRGSIYMSLSAPKSLYSPTTTLSYKVDWLSFTKKNKNSDPRITIHKIIDYLGYDTELFEEIPGRYFFNSGLTLGNFVNIFWNDASKSKAKFSSDVVSFHFTGVGCTDLADRLVKIYENEDREKNWIRYFQFLVDENCKFTRIDLALDDFTGKCNFDLMISKLKNGFYRSTKKTYSVSRGADQQGRSSGLTIYLGQPVKSSKGFHLLRMYKKLAEFESKNQLPPKIARESGVWDRYELEFTKTKAVDVINKILVVNEFSSVYLGILRSTVEFLNPTRNSKGQILKNKDSWKVCPWWERFLQDCESVRVGSDDIRQIELADLLTWVRIAVVPSLRLLEQIGLDRNFDIYSLIKSCDVEFSKKQKRLYLNSKTIPSDLLDLYFKEFKEGYKK